MASTGSRAFTAGSEFHRAPPARGGYVIRVLHTNLVLTQSPRPASQAGAAVMGDVGAVVGLGHGLHLRGDRDQLTRIDALPAGRLGHPDRERDERRLLPVAAALFELEVAAFGVGRVVEGIGRLLERLHGALSERVHLLGGTDDDEVVAADMAEEGRRQPDL